MYLKLVWQLFILFSRVALFSWGGGPASMGLMQREAVAAGWVTAEEFADALAIGNALPGPIAPQVSAYIGFKLAGWAGAVAAVAGTIVPTTLLMLLMVVYFFGIKDSPGVAAMLKAVRPVIIGLLLWTAYILAHSVFGVGQAGWPRGLLQNWDKLVLTAAAFGVLTLTEVNPVWLVLAGALLGFMLYR